MGPKITTSSKVDNTARLRDAIKRVARKRVLVGVPEDDAARRSGEVTNAQLMYLHTNGSTLQRIPARPVIEPAIQASDNKAIITGKLGNAARAVLDGQPNEARQQLEAAGIAGSNAAKRWFTDPRNNWAPNSPETERQKGSSRPLINTGQLRRAITYLVEDGG
jgi:hypothetical protein